MRLLFGQPIFQTVLVLAPALVVAQGCASMFSDARLVGRGRGEITPNVSAVGFSGGGETEHALNQFGFHAMVGIHDRADLGMGYARLQGDGGGTNAIGFGPRFGVVRNRVAIAAPVGFAFGGGVPISQSWQLHPAVLFTVPLSELVDFNPSARVLIPFCDGCEPLVGVGAGFGISPASRWWTIRPAVELIFNPGESGVIWSAGLGVSFRDR